MCESWCKICTIRKKINIRTKESNIGWPLVLPMHTCKSASFSLELVPLLVVLVGSLMYIAASCSYAEKKTVFKVAVE